MPKSAQNLNNLKINQAAKFLGVSAKTLRRWETASVLTPKRTSGNQRVYPLELLIDFKRLRSRSKRKYSRAVKEVQQVIRAPKPVKVVEKPIEGFSITSKQKFVVKGVFAAFALMIGVVGLEKLGLFSMDSLLVKETELGSKLVNFKERTGHVLSYIAAPFRSNTNKIDQKIAFDREGNILGVEDLQDAEFNVNIPANFAGDVNVEGNLTAPNITYTVSGGTGISVTGGQNPIVSLEADALEADTFGTIAVGSTNLVASGSDTLTFAGSSGISVSASTSNNTLTISASSSDLNISGWTDDGSSVRLSTIGDVVGIGTTSPDSKLQVDATSGDILNISNDDTSLFKVDSDGNVTLSTTGFLDLSNITHSTTATQGFRLPQNTTLSNPSSGEGYLAYDTDDDLIKLFNGTSWVNISGASTTLQQAYGNDIDGGDANISLDSDDDSIIITNPSSGGTDSAFVLSIVQSAAGSIDALSITNSGSGAGINLNNSTLVNIGAAGTDFTSTGGLTLASGSLLDLSSITQSSSTAQGLKLPQNTTLTNIVGGGEGFIAYDTTAQQVKVFDGVGWQSISGASTTLQQSYSNDSDGSDTIITLSADDDSLIFRNPASSGTDTGYVFGVEQLAAAAIDVINITNSGSGAGINLNNSTIVNIGDAGTDFTSTGGLNLAGTLDANGQVDLGDGGDTIILTGTTIGINSTGAGNDITLTSADDIIFDDAQLSTGLQLTLSDTGLNAALTQAVVDAINDIYDIATGGLGSSGFWQLSNKVLAPYNTTLDLAVGGNATSSATFQVFANTGSATTSGVLTFGGSTAQIQSTNFRPLLIGGDTTGTVNISPLNTTVATFTSSGLNLNNLPITNIGNAGTDFDTSGGLTLADDLTINGGDLISGTSTFNLLNSTATTINFGGAATSLIIGASTGLTDVKNSLNVTGDLDIDGGDLTASTSAFNLLQTGVTSLNIGGAATSISIGNSSGTIMLNNATTVVSGNLDVNGTSNDIAGTLNLSGNTLSSSGDLTIDPTGGGVKIGTGTPDQVDLTGDDLYVTGDLEVDGTIYGSIVGGINPSFVEGSVVFADSTGSLAEDNSSLFFDNTNNLLGIGTNTPHSKLHVSGAVTGKALVTLNETGDQNILTASASGVTVANLSRTGGLAIEGSISDLSDAALTVNDNLSITGDTLSSTQTTFNLLNSTTDTINFGGAATTLTIGAVSGTTTVRNDLAITGILDANNSGTNDIAGTLNLSGSSLTSSGDLVIDPTGGGVKIGTGTPDQVDLAGDDLYVTGDLEVDGVLYADGGIDTAFTAGSVVFAGTNGLLTQDNTNFFWDNTNKKLGIGTSPVGKLDVSGAVTGKALVILNETGDQNILSASASGVTVANLDRSGNLAIEGAISDLSGATLSVNDNLSITGDTFSATGALTITPNGAFTLGATGQTALLQGTTINLTSNGAGNDISITSADDIIFDDAQLSTGLQLTLTDTGINAGLTQAVVDAINDLYDIATGGVGSSGYWQLNTQVISPYISSLDLAIGGTATDSAKFQIFGDSGNATTSGTFTFNAGNQIQTTSFETLTIGGDTTGDINLTALNGGGFVNITGSTILSTSAFRLTTSPSSGYVLVSDGSGNGSWTDLSGSGSVGPWTLSGSTLYPDSAAYNILIGSTDTGDDIGKLNVSGAKTGKALAVLNETGDQNILTASASGVTVLNLERDGDLHADGVFSFGDTTPDGNAYNTIGTGDQSSGQVTNGDDLYITDDLEIDGTLYADGGIDTAFIAGSVVFAGASGVLAEDNTSLFFDDTNNLLGIGLATPHSKLHVSGAVTGKALVALNETGDQNILVASASGVTVATLGRTGDLAIEGSISDLSGTTLSVNDNLDVTGTTGISSSGNDAGLTFSGTGNHDITASAGTLRFGTATLTGNISGGAQVIDDLGELEFGAGNVDITGTTIGLTSDTDLLTLANNQLTIAGDLVLSGGDITGANGAAIDIGEATSGDVEITGNLLPATDAMYNLGSTAKSWQDLYLTGQLCFDDTDCITAWADVSGGTNYWQLNTNVLAPGGGASVTDRLVLGGQTSTVHQFEVNGAIVGKALVALNETGDQAILVASASGTNVLTLGRTGDLTLVDSGANNIDFNLSSSGDFTISDAGTPFVTFTDGGVVQIDSLNLDGTTIGLTTDTDLLSLSSGSLTINGDATVTTDLAVNGGDITTSGSTFNFITANATSVNLATAADTLSIGAGTGTTTINNATTAISGDLDVNGTSNDIAGTLNLSGSSLTSSGDLVIDPTGGGVKIGTGTPDQVDLAGDDLYVTGDLEVDGVLYADGGIDTAFTAGSVVFAGTNGLLTQDNTNFFWDNTNKKLGIGTSPVGKLDVSGAVTGKALVILNETGDQNILVASASGVNVLQLDRSGNITTVDNAWIGLGSGAGRLEFDDQATDEINFLSTKVGVGTTAPDSLVDINLGTSDAFQLTYNDSDGSATTYSRFTIDSSGNLTIDNTGTKTVVADDLQVTGNDILDSSATSRVTLGATTTLTNTGLTLSGTTGITASSLASITTSSSLAINGAATISSDQSSLTLFGTNATTINAFVAATTALNIGNGSGNYTAINIGSGTGTHTINIAGTGATAADTINIGTGGTAADTVNIGNSASTTALNFTSGTGSQTFASSVATGTTSTSAFVLTANALTSGTGQYLNSSSLTSGKLLRTSSSSTALTTGNLAYFDWSPSTWATASGDLVKIELGQYGDTTGNLFNILDNSSSLFSVSTSAVTSNLPVAFNAAGDVSVAYDLLFTNQTASYLKSSAPLYIEAGESFENNNLTLKTYGTGQIVTDGSFNGTNITSRDDETGTSTNTITGRGMVYYLHADSNTTDSDFTTTYNVTGVPDIYGTVVYINSVAEKGITVGSRTHTVAVQINGTQVSTVATATDTAASTVKESYTIVRSYDGWKIVGSTGTSDSADYSEIYKAESDVESAEVVGISNVDTITVGRATKQNVNRVIGVTSTSPAFVIGEEFQNEIKKLPVALSGRVPVKVSASSSPISIGDTLTVSNEPGKATKALGPGRTIGKALESWTPGTGKEKVLMFIENTWSDPSSSLTFDGSGNLVLSQGTLNQINSSINPTQLSEFDQRLTSLETTYNDGFSLLQNQIDLLTSRVDYLESEINLIKTASGSGQLVQEATTSATFNSLVVLDDVVLPDTVINGKLNIGTLELNNTDNSINAIGTLKVQSLGLGGIEFQGGKIEFDTNGNLLVNEGVIKGNDNFRGSVEIGVDEYEVQVLGAWDEAPVTVNVTPGYKTQVWVTDITSTGFTINVSSSPTAAKEIYWSAIW